VLSAADQPTREGVDAIAVTEFGVAGGNGLVALQHWTGAVGRPNKV